MTVCICTAFDTGFASLAELTLPVLVRYCTRHGYSLRTEMNPTGDIYWKRTEMLLSALDSFDVAVWMDTDSIVTNHAKRIEDFLAEDVRLLVSKDRNGINDGVLLARSYIDAVFTLQCVLSLRGYEGIHAPQDALQSLCNKGQAPCLRVVPNKLFNAFPAGSEGDTWEPGDFILQMPGINRERRIEIARETIPKIAW